MSVSRHRRRMRGFTLIELIVVIIILGVLAAVAVPKYIELGKTARIASLQSLAGTLNSTAQNMRVMCKMGSPICDYGTSVQLVVVAGQAVGLNYGWMSAGNSLAYVDIDNYVTYTGFTASLTSGVATRFALDGAPDPTNCAVTYTNAYSRGAASGIDVSLTSTGC